MSTCLKALPVAATLLALVPSLSWALTTPAPCGQDTHVRCASYQINEVYRVPFRAGNATLIQFEEGEVIDGPASGLGMGDTRAWKVGAKGNWVIFKPDAMGAATNMVIVTDRRRYVFALVSAHGRESPCWSLSFDYPDTRARSSIEAAARSARAAAALRAGVTGASGAVRQNLNYEMRGDTVLAPTALWDDGRFTYFQYATSRDLPVTFRILPDGEEALVNSHVDGDTVVVHETSAQFVLRLGQAVLGIRNNAYTPDGAFNRTGTSVPGTVRLPKEDR